MFLLPFSDVYLLSFGGLTLVKWIEENLSDGSFKSLPFPSKGESEHT